MPDDYYVSQYSGEEIDAMLASAGAGNVRYDAAQTLTDEQKTQARTNINAAPGNFGFGSLPPVISDPDSLAGTVDGIYYFYNLDNPIEGNDAGILVHYQGNFREVSSSCRQIFYPGGKWAYHLERAYSGTWNAWEWVNPPMVLGVEYRTTERYLGKPVYVKAVGCGGVPTNSVKTVSFDPSYDDVSTASTFRALCVWGVTSGHWTLPALLYGYGLDRSINIGGYFNGILIGTTETGTPDTITAVVKYIKTTD